MRRRLAFLFVPLFSFFLLYDDPVWSRQEKEQDPEKKAQGKKGGGGGGFGQGKRGEGFAKKERDFGPGAPLPETYAGVMQWRCIGPATMGGRVTALAVYEADPTTYWVASASGGLLKTVNAGTTFVHQFDKEATVSIGDVAVAPSDKSIVWVGTGEANPRNSVSYGDGVYKSTDGGKTWTNMGLKKSYQIGKILIHPKDPNIVYVGAMGRCYGPNEERGLFKTTDGGKTWEKILYQDDKTGVIDMRLDPNAPDTLYVAMWARQRDEFDSYIGEPVPEGYDGYDPTFKWSEKAGIYKTTDGGKNFKKLTNGLPSGKYGRIGLDMYAKDTKTLFAIVDCEKIGMGTPPKKDNAKGPASYMGIRGEDSEEPRGAKLTRVVEGDPAAKAGLAIDDIITKVDGKEVEGYTQLRDLYLAKKPGDKLKIEYQRGEEMKTTELTLTEPPAGGAGGFQAKGGGGGGALGAPGNRNTNRPYTAQYAGQSENVQDQQGPNSHEYGGVYKSTDAGETWTRINSINHRPMYFSVVRVDPNDDKLLYTLGVSMYRSTDGGKTFKGDASRGVHADQHALWIDPKDGRHMIVGCDGGVYVSYDRANNWDHLNTMTISQFYHVAVSPQQPYYVYGGLQDNGSWGGPSVGQKGNTGPINEDWISVGGGDGFVMRVDPVEPDVVYYESQNGRIVRRNLRTGEQGSVAPRPPQGAGLGQGRGQGRAKGELPKDKEKEKDDTAKKDQPKAEQPKGENTAARPAQYRFNWNTPFILSNFNSRIVYCAGEYVFRSFSRGDGMAAISPEITRTKRGSGTALSESPRNPDIVWAGTDDGFIWVTKNGGKDWKNVTQKLGLKKPLWISTIEASRFADGRAYVCVDGHRSDDDDPYVFVTEDFGETFKPIKGNLPTGSTRCLREDIENPNLLYCGTEFSLFASTDRGTTWTKINNNLPTVAVHEVALHPTAGEIVLATHGRGIWIADVTALREMSTDVLKTDKPVLLKPNTVTRYAVKPSMGRTNRRFVGTNPAPTVPLVCVLPKRAEKTGLKIFEVNENKQVAELKVPALAGMHRIQWDQTANGRFAPAGTYRVVLTVDDKEVGTQILKIVGDPNATPRFGTDDEDDEDEIR